MLVHYNSVNNSIKPGFRNACLVLIFFNFFVMASNSGGGIFFPRIFKMGREFKLNLIQHQECTGGSMHAVLGGATLVRF